MTKRIIALICAVIISLLILPSALADGAPANSARSVILMHADTGTVIYEENADERMLIASTTKIMTALVALENCPPDEIITVRREDVLVEGSSMYLKQGEQYTLLELIYGLLLVSGNDAALCIANHIGGSVAGFADLMNARAQQMGLSNTSFKNPHGLDAEGHFSTSRDLASIMSEAMKNNVFAEITKTKQIVIKDLTYVNHNKLLWNYDGMVGGKTGYTMAAGRSLVSCAERDGMRLICVTLGDPDDWSDHTDLYNWAFDAYVFKDALPMGEYSRIPVISGDADTVGVAPEGNLRIFVKRSSEFKVRLELPRFVYADVREGQTAGSAAIIEDGKIVGSVNLRYTESVGVGKGIRLTPWERFTKAWYLANSYGPIVNYGYYSFF